MEGFVPGSRASFILDFIVLAMAAVLPVLLFSLLQVKRRQRYQTHRSIQIGLGIVLGLTILAFEVNMRLWGWRHMAEPSPYFDTWVFPALYIHLCFSIPTLILWAYTIFEATRQQIMAAASRGRFRHRTYGRLSAYSMVATTVTGWIFYWLAFVAA